MTTVRGKSYPKHCSKIPNAGKKRKVAPLTYVCSAYTSERLLFYITHPCK